MRYSKKMSCMEGRREGRTPRFDTSELPVRYAYLLSREGRQNVIVLTIRILGRMRNFSEIVIPIDFCVCSISSSILQSPQQVSHSFREAERPALPTLG